MMLLPPPLQLRPWRSGGRQLSAQPGAAAAAAAGPSRRRRRRGRPALWERGAAAADPQPRGGGGGGGGGAGGARPPGRRPLARRPSAPGSRNPGGRRGPDRAALCSRHAGSGGGAAAALKGAREEGAGAVRPGWAAGGAQLGERRGVPEVAAFFRKRGSSWADLCSFETKPLNLGPRFVQVQVLVYGKPMVGKGFNTGGCCFTGLVRISRHPRKLAVNDDVLKFHKAPCTKAPS
uniref:AT-rich interactive domain-containing protein 1A-like n=1 Tax=Odobenus rosmarus divergens TaxID=9708 RepID=UPI00063C012C|nr:PREDICTED: AT-rich interactive domain-containing protein 1A-like [Odobenus rosmarus divergens]